MKNDEEKLNYLYKQFRVVDQSIDAEIGNCRSAKIAGNRPWNQSGIS